MAKHFSSEGTAKAATLLTLPAELRNQIWRDALPVEVTVTKDDPRPALPPLSLTCRQVQKETLPIFLFETTFKLHIADWEGDFIFTFFQHLDEDIRLARDIDCVPTATPTPHFRTVLAGKESWRNLIAWAKAEHAYVGPRPPIVLQQNERTEAGGKILGIATRMREKPWSDVEEAINSFYRSESSMFDTKWEDWSFSYVFDRAFDRMFARVFDRVVDRVMGAVGG